MRTLRCSGAAAVLVLFAAANASAQTAASTKPNRVLPGGFHAVLLLAENTPGALPTELPAGVAKALKEASELLPFKSYQIQDQALLRSNGSPIHKIHLLGPLSRDYELYLELKYREAEKVSVVVSLTYTSVDVKGRTEVLATEFSARLGETVVVGTSRVKGDKSLVLLITPLAQDGVRGNPPDNEVARLGIERTRMRNMTTSKDRIVMTGAVELDIAADTVFCDEAVLARSTGEILLLGKVHIQLSSLPHIEAMAATTKGTVTYYRGSVTIPVGTAAAAVFADEAIARTTENVIELGGSVRLAVRGTKKQPE